MARDYWAYYTPSDIGLWADRDLGEARFVERVYEMAQAARPRVQMKELYQEYRSLLAGKRASDDEEEYTMLSEEVQEVHNLALKASPQYDNFVRPVKVSGSFIIQ